RLGAAVGEQAAAALGRIFDPDFEARLFADAHEARLEGDTFSVGRRERAGDADRQLTAAEFVKWLMDLRRPFSPAPKFDFGISSLSPVARDNLDGDWRGTCKMRMWGFAEADQPAETVVILQFRTLRPQEKRLAQPGWFLACSIEQ